MQNLTNS